MSEHLGEVPVIDLLRLTKTYGQGETAVHALAGVDLVIEKGEYVAVMGASGSGKSTLMNIVGCLDTGTSGRYLLDGVDVRRLSDRQLSLGAEPQDRLHLPELQPDPPHLGAAERGAAPGLRRRAGRRAPRPGAGRPGSRRAGRPRPAPPLRAVRRAAAARGRGAGDRHRPRPAAGRRAHRRLDSRSTADVLALFDELAAEGRTVVVITHEDDVAAHARRVLRMTDGLVVSDSTSTPVVA